MLQICLYQDLKSSNLSITPIMEQITIWQWDSITELWLHYYLFRIGRTSWRCGLIKVYAAGKLLKMRCKVQVILRLMFLWYIDGIKKAANFFVQAVWRFDNGRNELTSDFCSYKKIHLSVMLQKNSYKRGTSNAITHVSVVYRWHEKK